MTWIVKVGDGYLDGFDNWWSIQARAYRYKTREAAENAAMASSSRRVVKLVPSKDYVVHYPISWGECYVSKSFVRDDGTPDFFGTPDINSADIFTKEAAELFANAWNNMWDDDDCDKLVVSCLNP